MISGWGVGDRANAGPRTVTFGPTPGAGCHDHPALRMVVDGRSCRFVAPSSDVRPTTTIPKRDDRGTWVFSAVFVFSPKGWSFVAGGNAPGRGRICIGPRGGPRPLERQRGTTPSGSRVVDVSDPGALPPAMDDEPFGLGYRHPSQERRTIPTDGTRPHSGQRADSGSIG